MSYNTEANLSIGQLKAIAMGRKILSCENGGDFNPYGKTQPRTIGYISVGMAVKSIGEIFLKEEKIPAEVEKALAEIMENSPLASVACNILCERKEEISAETLASIKKFEQSLEDASSKTKELEAQ